MRSNQETPRVSIWAEADKCTRSTLALTDQRSTLTEPKWAIMGRRSQAHVE